jgi:hypothetical protein
VENKQKFISQIMTSKTPVRVAEDVDETALSYAEIKALATGNPEIIEHCNLTAEVGKLKTLKSSHLSQRYELEDKILKTYPAEIKRLEERITGYAADIEMVKQHPANKDYFPPMKIGGILYAEKADAGKAIIEACKAMTSPEPVPLGEYRGFVMDLSYEPFSKEYRIALKGALTHQIALGADIHGNITRLDNALDGTEPKLALCKEQLANVHAQMETAKAEAQVSFPREAELAEKTARLARGIGYEFAGQDIYGVDLDHVIENDLILPEAKAIVDGLASYTEISPSGHGLHIFVTAEGANITRHRKHCVRWREIQTQQALWREII